MVSIKERQASKAASINLDDEDTVPASTVRAEPRTAPGQLMNLQGKYAQALDENKSLQEQLSEAMQRELLISELHEVPGRRRKLTEEQFKELSVNLRNNPLVTPITVRKIPVGGYEIVSGHNRVQIYKDLGRERILAAIIETDDDQVVLSAFYANLLQPDLPDFEKYLGFNEIEMRYPNLTRVEIANNAGISASTVTQLMSFGGLPAEAIDILRDRPEILGANAAQDFSRLNASGKGQQVVEAIKKIVTGELDQSKAVKFASRDPASIQKIKSNTPVRIKSGNSIYCDLLRADKALRIVFKSNEEAGEAQEEIRALLEKMAESKRNKN